MNGIALLVAALMSCPGALTAAGTGTETEPVREWQTDPEPISADVTNCFM